MMPSKNNPYLLLGKAAKTKGKYLEAIDFYLKAIEKESKCYQAYIELENTPISSYKLDELINFYYRIIEKKLDIPFTWGNLADTLTLRGQIQEAIQCYQVASYKKAIAKNPELEKFSWGKRKQKPPDFVIIGAPRCGTTSLFVYLQKHPQIISPTRKEISFFTTNFNKGVDWYLAHFPTLADEEDFITGEATATYLYDLNAAQRLKQTCPNIKIIVLLRNPSDRTISWYNHKVTMGRETRSLDVALENDFQELQTLTPSQKYDFNLITSNNLLGGFYLTYLKEWMKLFTKEQVLILKSEDFYSQTQMVMTRVFDFLGLPNYQKIDYRAFNTTEYASIEQNIKNKLDQIYLKANLELEKFLGTEFYWYQPTMNNQNKVAEIQKYVKRGELEKAISTGEEILNQYHQELQLIKDNIALAYEKQGKICQQKGEWQEAKKLYQQAINYSPTCLPAYGGLCDIFVKEKAWQQLREIAIECLKFHGNAAWLYIHLMTASRELGEEESSLEMWQKACEIKGWQDCRLKDYRFRKERLLINHLDALSFALHQFENNQTLNALEIGVQEGLVTCWLLDNLLIKNRDTITCTTDKFSDYFSTNINKSQAAEKVKKLEIKSSESFNYLPKNYYQLVYIHPRLSQGNILPLGEIAEFLAPDGILILADYSAEKLNLQDWEVVYNKKIIIARYKINRAYNQEIQDLTKAAETSPTAHNYLALGKELKKQGYLDQAIECYFKAMMIDPQFLPTFFDLRFNFLRYKLKSNSSSSILNKVIDFCHQLLRQNPEHIWLNILLGYALTKQEKIEEAVNYYQQASNREAKNLKSYISEDSWGNVETKKPQFIVIGAEKCGTTSLYWYLRQHPKIFTSLEKELDFFDQEFDKGIDWYLSHFAQVPKDDTYFVGEVSPNYIYNLLAPQRIYDFLPTAKLIVLLRNPIERSISRYFMIAKNSQKSLNTREDLSMEIQQLAKAENDGDIDFKILTRYSNIGNSLYYYHLKRWLNIFPREQILVVKSEDFYSQPSATMANIFDYLGLPNYSLDSYPKHNSGDYAPIDEELRAKLGDFFKIHNQRLEDLLGLKFDWQ